jgi:hypothetical protein
MKTFRDDEFTRSKLIILENLETHSNLFDLEYESTNDYTECLRLAKNSSSDFKNNLLVLKLKKSRFESSNNDTASQVASTFTNASNYIAFCSYRNQLVCFLIRVSLFSHSLLASTTQSIQGTTNEALIFNDFDLSRALYMFKFLLRLLNKEFIFKPDSEEKDFNDSLNYLVHTNVLTKTNDGRFELVKSSLRQFFFYAKMFEYILENYAQVYKVCLSLNNSASTQKFTFNDEKQFTKNLQTKIFDEFLPGSASANNPFDLEVLSLNLLTNSLTTLNQFSVINRQSRSEYVLDMAGLNVVHNNLRFIVDVAQVKLSELNRLFKSDDLSSSIEFEFDFGDSKWLAQKQIRISNRTAEFDLSSKL